MYYSRKINITEDEIVIVIIRIKTRAIIIIRKINPTRREGKNKEQIQRERRTNTDIHRQYE